MRALRLLALLGAGLLAACSGSQKCQDVVHKGCDLDGGATCDAHSTCLDVGLSVDPCASGATACCYVLCSKDSDCPSDEVCATAGSITVCAHGKCVAQ